MEIREVFARNLKALRLAKGLSQEELAHLADIDRTYISSLERCVYNASIDVVQRLASVLGVEASDLLLRRPTGPTERDLAVENSGSICAIAYSRFSMESTPGLVGRGAQPVRQSLRRPLGRDQMREKFSPSSSSKRLA